MIRRTGPRLASCPFRTHTRRSPQPLDPLLSRYQYQQITFRPLKDTSPASLPHTSTRDAAPRSISQALGPAVSRSPPLTQSSRSPGSDSDSGRATATATATATANRNRDRDRDRTTYSPMVSPTAATAPRADPPAPVSTPRGSSGMGIHTRGGGGGGGGGRATTAAVGTVAQPHLNQNRPVGGASGGMATDQARAAAHVGQGQGQGQGQGNEVDDEDGSSIMGRAANIASTAKDLFGALWSKNGTAPAP